MRGMTSHYRVKIRTYWIRSLFKLQIGTIPGRQIAHLVCQRALPQRKCQVETGVFADV